MQKYLHTHKYSFSTVSTLGDFDVINLRDITTEGALESNTAIIEFELDPMTNLDTSRNYHVRVTWSQISGLSSGVVEAANCRFYNPSNARLERVGLTGTFCLSVPVQLLGEGCLLVNLIINISCISYRYRYSRYQCGCYDWQIRGASDFLEK